MYTKNSYQVKMAFKILLVFVAIVSLLHFVHSLPSFSNKFSTKLSCPAWTQTKNGTCVCKPEKYFFKQLNSLLQCEENSNGLSVLDCHCLTWDASANTLEVGGCIENSMNVGKSLIDKLYLKQLSPNENYSVVNNKMCKNRFNRIGTLCGKCLPPYSPQAYSYDIKCVNCTEGNTNLWKYFVFSLAPLTCFYFIVLFLKVNTTASHLHAYIIFTQAITFPQFARILIMTLDTQPKFIYPIKILGALYGIWTLDFFRMFNLGICLDMSPLSVIALDYIIAVYPFLLTVLSYVLIALHDKNYKAVVLMWKPFRCVFTLFRRNWDIRTSVIDAYASFFQLSCFKILCISFDLLIPTTVYTVEDNPKTRLVVYYDGTVDFFSNEHIPYAILALTFMILFAILPTLLLLFYPCRCFQYLMSRCHCHSHILQTFLDSINGCYKDGTEPGSRDCRWFAAVDLLSRFFLFMVFSFTLGSMYFPIAVMVILLIVILICNLQPHKTTLSHYDKIDVTFYCLLCLFYVAISASNISSIKQRFYVKGCYTVVLLLGIFPLLYMSCLSIYWVFSRRRWGKTFIDHLRAWRRGYDLLHDLPDRMLNPGNYEQGLEDTASLSMDTNQPGSSSNWYTG